MNVNYRLWLFSNKLIWSNLPTIDCTDCTSPVHTHRNTDKHHVHDNNGGYKICQNAIIYMYNIPLLRHHAEMPLCFITELFVIRLPLFVCTIT